MQATTGRARESGRSRRQRGGFVGFDLLAILVLATFLGCAGTPPVAAPPPGEARVIRAETPLDWARKRTACADARKRAERAARKQCHASYVATDTEACDCRAGESVAGTWRCSATASYRCDDAL